MPSDLARLFSPHSVAVIGASEALHKPGRRVLEQLRATSIRCYPVHPKNATVLGVPAFSSVADLPEVVDVAVVAVGAAAAVEAVQACAERGIPFVVVLAGGFGEAGEAGAALERRLAAAVAGWPTRVLGPNTVGLQVPESGLDTVFVDHASDGPADPARGGVVFVSQSGSVAVEALGAAATYGLPLRAFIGLGNAVDLQSREFVEFAADDPRTGSIALYLEHLGEGRPLLAAARSASERVPVFVLKAGRTSAGAAAVASHTGRLAGSDRVVGGALRQYGLQRVSDDEELVDAIRAVSYARVPAGNRVAIVTPAGGYGVMGTDYIEEPAGIRTLRLAQLDPATVARIREVSLPFASSHNPVDVTAGADTEQFAAAVAAVLEDPNTDLVIVYAFFAPPGITDALVERVVELIRGTEKSVLVFAHSGTRTDEYCRRFTGHGVAAYPSLNRAVRAARILVERHALRARRPWSAEAIAAPGTAWIVDDWLRACPGAPNEADAKQLLDAYGITTPRRMVTGRGERLARPAFDGPYAVKVSSADLLHKTDAGAIRLNVHPAELPAAAEELRATFPDCDLIVEEMIRDISVELIAGATRDIDLGPALMLGAGGILTELYRDVTFRLAPVSPSELAVMTDELTVSPLLTGFRGIAADREALVAVLGRLSALVADLGERFSEFDVNPLCYAGGRWIALDAKMVLRTD